MVRQALVMLVQDYLAGTRSLEELQCRVVDIIWADRIAIPADTLQLAQMVDLGFAELSGGHISEDAFQKRLMEVAGINAATILDLVNRPTLQTSAVTRRRSAAFG
jgi:hypothetical protein